MKRKLFQLCIFIGLVLFIIVGTYNPKSWPLLLLCIPVIYLRLKYRHNKEHKQKLDNFMSECRDDEYFKTLENNSDED